MESKGAVFGEKDLVYVYGVHISKHIQFPKTSSWDSNGYDRLALGIVNMVRQAIGREQVLDVRNLGSGDKATFSLLTSVEIPSKVAEEVANYKVKSSALYSLIDITKTVDLVEDLIAARPDSSTVVYDDEIRLVLARTFVAADLVLVYRASYPDTGFGSDVKSPVYSTSLVGIHKGQIMGELDGPHDTDLYHCNWWRKTDAIRKSVTAKMGVVCFDTIDLQHVQDLESEKQGKFNWCLGFGWDKDISDRNRWEPDPVRAARPRWYGSEQDKIHERVVAVGEMAGVESIGSWWLRQKEAPNVWRMIKETISMIPVDKDSKLNQELVSEVNRILDCFEAKTMTIIELAEEYANAVDHHCARAEKSGQAMGWRTALIRHLKLFSECRSGTAGMIL